ncbi:hypothetical protein Glove_130g123 [Diversispora epigaea]|uniref:Dihydropteridine reductase n=1 Tax=Diversispora epigaea TaxID=1348612 RepID=A0A397J6U8_9GLOM|nr:hypothetical protein Glove_130g123 [Diversispora epigaea]
MSSKVVIYGGTGQLGTAVISHFKIHNWEVTSIGTRPNTEANHNIVVSANDSLEVQGTNVLNQAKEQLKGGEKYDAILNVAGGFAMGNAASEEFLKNSDLMIKKILYPSLISAQLAAHHLKEKGVLALTATAGAANYNATPGFIGYGVSKAGVVQLVKSLAEKGSGLPKCAKVTAISPGTIDTAVNRQNFPKADFTNFIPLDKLTNYLYGCASGDIKVDHGRVVEIVTKKGVTTFTILKDDNDGSEKN